MQTVLVDFSDWLLLGTILGIVLSVVIAGAFTLGSYLFPYPNANDAVQSGDTRRRTEIRRYLQAIDEPFVEDHFVADHTVEFYLPKRDVAITFDARAFYSIERSPTHVVLVEHEMPGIYLGDRLPFETPEISFGTDRDGNSDSGPEDRVIDRSEAAYAVLGLPSNATEQQIKEAYREKIKVAHPDMGGDPESFQQVKEAYATVREHAQTDV